jgi:glycerol-3-phosphate O-acyltransferase
MEAGHHNLFFPGGTRSRSGAVEQRLKLGLLGMGLDAYIHNLKARTRNPDIFVVPCTINYELVLEAETLIDDHLKEVGRSRYIIEDDEFSRPRQVLQFVQRLFSLESRVNVRFSRPLDVFGNPVDDEGRSLDSRGRLIDRALYVDTGDGPGADPQRDEEYTRELSQAIVDAFHRDTVLKATHVVSRAVFDLLRDRNPGMDLYRLLRTGGDSPSLPLPEVYQRLDRVLEAVRRAATEGRVRLDGAAARGDAVAVSSEAQEHLSSYHRRPAIERHGDRLVAADRNLLLYYGNRVDREVLR